MHTIAFHYVSFAKQISIPVSFFLFSNAIQARLNEMNRKKMF